MFRKIFAGVTGSPWFAALTALLGGLAGMLGSVFSTEIKSVFPFIWPGVENIFGAPYVWQPTFFWCVLLLFGACFQLSISAETKANKAALNKLTENTEKLEKLITTLPDKKFLSFFEDQYELAFEQLTKATQSGANQLEIKYAIIGCLSALGHLAKQFDGRDPSFKYAIHVMLFREIPADTGELKCLLERVRFTEKNADPQKWRGILDSYCDFALVMGNNGDFDPDPHVVPFALPVPLNEFRSDEGRSTILPVVVEVFCSPDKIKTIADTSKVANWMRENYGFRMSLAEEIEQYFSKPPGQFIKSIASLPFGRSSNQSDEYPDEPFGVINIHSNRPDILKGDGGQLFFPLTTPFLHMLGELFKRLEH